MKEDNKSFIDESVERFKKQDLVPTPCAKEVKSQELAVTKVTEKPWGVVAQGSGVYTHFPFRTSW